MSSEHLEVICIFRIFASKRKLKLKCSYETIKVLDISHHGHHIGNGMHQ